jgi:hypothetical protein
MPAHPSLNQNPLKLRAPVRIEETRPLITHLEPTKRKYEFNVEDKHIKTGKRYAMGLIVALGSVFSILVVFSILMIMAANKVQDSVQPLGRSLATGDLHKTVQEAHLALHSVRKLSDSIPMDQIVKHWGHTNNILEKSKIPWKELPQWRLFAQNAFRITTDMLKQHPDWAKNIEQSTDNLKATATPLAVESKEWRKSLRGASAAYAKTLMTMYKEYLNNDSDSNQN